ncbi:MAG: Chitinase [uncultured Frankineae bacterium]|uniref:Chitinase n=1 Tax=uncultured Frankineae bacterium TaxID=437475 RepID=A0A6J4L3D9_9ACTN|nr:MAG: Chitinase [uncultured Frankineae bacterium]
MHPSPSAGPALRRRPLAALCLTVLALVLPPTAAQATETSGAYSDADLVTAAPGPQDPASATTTGTTTGATAGTTTGATAVVPTGRAAGAEPVGTTQYVAPSDARYVAPNGSDSAAGTATAPWRTVAKAVRAARDGATLVLRGGTYSESVTAPSGKRLTIQSAPGEAVWLDGSKVVTGWTADGGDWRLSGWTAEFDHSPTYTAGAPDSTEPGWSFVNARYPMAAHPEQVFVDGVAQQQVRTRDDVEPGTFFADRAGDRIYLGTDPRGKEVRSSTLQTALTMSGEGSVLRGVGVRRYATSVPLMGTVRVLADGAQLENVHVSDNATQGVFVRGRGVQLRNVTSERNGLMGVLANHADDLVADSVRADHNNTEHFNGSPAAGGFKLTRLRGVRVTNSSTSHNEGSGLWFDESVYDTTVVGNDSVGNTRNGISFEISSKAVFADNLLADNGTTGLKINNAQSVSIWNNTITGNEGRPVWLVQDDRVAKDLSTPGHDPRQTLPDPTVTWVLGPITVKNNVITAGGSNCLLCLQDSALLRSAETIGVTANGNAYHRPTASSPTWISTWSDGTSSPDVYTTVRSFRSAERQESTGTEFTGAPVLDSTWAPTEALLTAVPTTAQPLDATIAALTGEQAGERHLGAWMLDRAARDGAAAGPDGGVTGPDGEGTSPDGEVSGPDGEVTGPDGEASQPPADGAGTTPSPAPTVVASPRPTARPTSSPSPSPSPTAGSTLETTAPTCKPGGGKQDASGAPPGHRCRVAD